MFSGHSAIKTIINNKKEIYALVGRRATVWSGVLSCCPNASLCSSLPWQLHAALPSALSSPGVRSLDWSLRGWSEVLLQTELSIRIQIHPERKRGRESGASAGGEVLWETCSNYEKSHFPMLGIRSECNRPSRLETWLRAQKARWPVRQCLNACYPVLGPSW